MTPVAFFKLLADTTRLRCLLLMQSESEICVCELTAALQISQPKISRHLAALREAGLVVDRRQGTWVFYRLNEALPGWAKQILAAAAEPGAELVTVDRQRLQTIGKRPNRQQLWCSE